MNQNQAIRAQFRGKKLLPCVIENALDCLNLAKGSAPLPKPASNPDSDESIRKNISGRLLAVSGNTEAPLEGALVEIHAVTPLKKVINTLSNTVLAHCRTLLLESVKPVDLYHASKYVVDEPLLGFADVRQLRDIPGYELLAAAARSQADVSFRRLLSTNPTIARLLLCYYHPASFSTVPMACTQTDSAGRFQYSVLEPINADDRPGYVFSARRKISSDLYVTLYKPTPVAWHTHWYWPPGTAATLRTSHPLTQQEQMQR